MAQTGRQRQEPGKLAFVEAEALTSAGCVTMYPNSTNAVATRPHMVLKGGWDLLRRT